MSYVEQLSAVSPIERGTPANGDWFTSAIIRPLDDNITMLANAIDTAGVDYLDEIRDEIAAGLKAVNKIDGYDFDAISASAKSGAEARTKIGTTDFTGLVESAKSGQFAYNKVKDYDLAAIKTSATNGAAASAKIKDINFASLSASAVNAAKALNGVKNVSANVDWLEKNKSQIENSAKSAGAAYTAIANVSGKINAATNYINSSAKTLDDLATYLKENSGKFDSAYTTLDTYKDRWTSMMTSAAAWTNTYNIVCAGSSNWNAMLANRASDWNTMKGAYDSSGENWIAVSDYMKRAEIIDSKVGVIVNNSAKWNTVYNLDKSNWYSMTSTLTAADDWDTMKGAYDSSARRWNNVYATVNEHSSTCWALNCNSSVWLKPNNLTAYTNFVNNTKSANWNTMYAGAQKLSSIFNYTEFVEQLAELKATRKDSSGRLNTWLYTNFPYMKNATTGISSVYNKLSASMNDATAFYKWANATDAGEQGLNSPVAFMYSPFACVNGDSANSGYFDNTYSVVRLNSATWNSMAKTVATNSGYFVYNGSSSIAWRKTNYKGIGKDATNASAVLWFG